MRVRSWATPCARRRRSNRSLSPPAIGLTCPVRYVSCSRRAAAIGCRSQPARPICTSTRCGVGVEVKREKFTMARLLTDQNVLVRGRVLCLAISLCMIYSGYTREDGGHDHPFASRRRRALLKRLRIHLTSKAILTRNEKQAVRSEET